MLLRRLLILNKVWYLRTLFCTCATQVESIQKDLALRAEGLKRAAQQLVAGRAYMSINTEYWILAHFMLWPTSIFPMLASSDTAIGNTNFSVGLHYDIFLTSSPYTFGVKPCTWWDFSYEVQKASCLIRDWVLLFHSLYLQLWCTHFHFKALLYSQTTYTTTPTTY